MADRIILDASLTAVADAIRAKVGTPSSLSFPTGFLSALDSIPSTASGLFKIKTGLITIGSDSTVLSITGLGFTPEGFVFALRDYANASTRGLMISTFSYPGRVSTSDTIYGLYNNTSTVNEGSIKANITRLNGSLSVTITSSNIRWKDTYFYVVWGN